MALAMNEAEFASFLMFLKCNIPKQGMPIRKAATVIGQQPCGQVWVMGKDIQVSSTLLHGHILTIVLTSVLISYLCLSHPYQFTLSDDSQYIWLNPTLLGDIGYVPSSDVLPSIQLPLSNSANTIVRLLSLLKVSLKHNFVSGVLAVAGGVMSLHYRNIIQVFSSKAVCINS